MPDEPEAPARAAEPRVWRHRQTLIVEQRYGGCFDVIELGAVGVDVIEEISRLPPNAVELTASEAHEVQCPGCGTTIRARMADSALPVEAALAGSRDLLGDGPQPRRPERPPGVTAPRELSDEAIDRAARALYGRSLHESTWEQLHPEVREVWRGHVRAVAVELARAPEPDKDGHR